MRRLPLSYVLPLRRWEREPLTELTAYLAWLSTEVEVILVDGSASELFALHHEAWGSIVTHIPVDEDRRSHNGKVGGVITGVSAASYELVVIADDDVRYDRDVLQRISHALHHADLVRPQNFFEPLTWQARLDTARTLINRSLGHDYPGTLAVRRSLLLAAGGYDGSVLFENLELIRTVEAAGGRVTDRRDLYVRRQPPSSTHFKRQRVRHAYESFAQPLRMGIELTLLPAMLTLLLRRRFLVLAWSAACAAGLAEVGRHRANGRTMFPISSSALAPAWVAERALCAWAAVWLRLRRGGMPYAGTTFAKAATSRRALRRRLDGRSNRR